MKMQVLACNYTSVKVVTLRTMREEYDASITETNSTNRLSTSILRTQPRLSFTLALRQTQQTLIHRDDRLSFTDSSNSDRLPFKSSSKRKT